MTRKSIGFLFFLGAKQTNNDKPVEELKVHCRELCRPHTISGLGSFICCLLCIFVTLKRMLGVQLQFLHPQWDYNILYMFPPMCQCASIIVVYGMHLTRLQGRRLRPAAVSNLSQTKTEFFHLHSLGVSLSLGHRLTSLSCILMTIPPEPELGCESEAKTRLMSGKDGIKIDMETKKKK